jgi:nicotinamidase-related amidase
MTTLGNRPNTPLAVVDAQNAALERAHERDAVVANVGSLVERARRDGMPVVWVQHFDEQLCTGQRRLTDRFRTDSGRRGAAGREEPPERDDEAFDRELAVIATKLTTLKEVLERPVSGRRVAALTL